MLRTRARLRVTNFISNTWVCVASAAFVCLFLPQNAHNVLVASSFVSPYGMVAKVADLGLSRVLKQHATHRTTRTVRVTTRALLCTWVRCLVKFAVSPGVMQPRQAVVEGNGMLLSQTCCHCLCHKGPEASMPPSCCVCAHMTGWHVESPASRAVERRQDVTSCGHLQVILRRPAT